MKIWAVVIILSLLSGSALGMWKSGYNRGYDKRDAEVQQEIIDAQEAARAEAEEFWKQALADAEAQVIVEERIVTEIREVEKKIPQVVEKIVEVRPECNDLGPDFISVLNDQIRAANSVPSAPTEP